VKWEGNRAHIEKLWERKERRQAQSAARQATKVRGEDTPTESESSVEEEGDVTLPPFHDITGQQVWILVGECQLKQTQTGTTPSTYSPQQSCLMPVSSNSKGKCILPC
jgi:hypothetical protein